MSADDNTTAMFLDEDEGQDEQGTEAQAEDEGQDAQDTEAPAEDELTSAERQELDQLRADKALNTALATIPGSTHVKDAAAEILKTQPADSMPAMAEKLTALLAATRPPSNMPIPTLGPPIKDNAAPRGDWNKSLGALRRDTLNYR